jgi:putative nucleotidyltransferase with HDIG domain
MTKKTILFVDDENHILKGLRRILYPLHDKWDMCFVASGAEALLTMQQKKIAVLVTDMRMPSMTGVQLLQIVQKEHPEITRVMLTGQPDIETYRDAITLSHYFLWKPTKYEDFEILFNRIKEMETALTNDNLVRLIGGITSLPSLPTLFVRLTSLFEQEETDVAQITEVIGEDIAMAALVLKLVNSSFLGLTRRIESLEQAVAYLGINMMRNLVLVQQLFSQCTQEEFSEFRLDELWKHSFRVARLAKQVASNDKHGPLIQDYAYLAGLLHDIGKLVLVRHLPDYYRKIIAITDKNGRPCIEVEQEILGADHASIGGYLVSLWGLPRRITEAVTFHQTESFPGAASTSPVFDAVWQANRTIHN